MKLTLITFLGFVMFLSVAKDVLAVTTSPSSGTNVPFKGGPSCPVRRMRSSPSKQQNQRQQQLESKHDQYQQHYSDGVMKELCDIKGDRGGDGFYDAPTQAPLIRAASPPHPEVSNKFQYEDMNAKSDISHLTPLTTSIGSEPDPVATRGAVGKTSSVIGVETKGTYEMEKKINGTKNTSSAMHHIQESKTREELRYRPVIVGICGGTGSGKTTLTKAIVERLGAEHVSLVSHDSYYRDLQHLVVKERANVNFDHPDALDSELLYTHIGMLKEGIPVKCPVYDFTTHSRKLDEYDLVNPSKIVLVDGILIFAEPRLLEAMDMKIFVDTADDIRLIRRLTRDIAERARTVENVIDQYHATVRPMHKLFVEPSRRAADIIVPSCDGIQEVALDMVVSRLRELIAQHEQDLEELRQLRAPMARRAKKE